VCCDGSGLYQTLVSYEGMVVPGSETTFCVFDPSAIRVCPMEPVACNELVEFTGEYMNIHAVRPLEIPALLLCVNVEIASFNKTHNSRSCSIYAIGLDNVINVNSVCLKPDIAAVTDQSN